MHDYTGKTVFVAGGTTGINFAIAEGFAWAGARLFVASRKDGNVRAAVEKLSAIGQPAAGATADVRDLAAVEAAFAACAEKFGEIDVLISGAAGNFPIYANALSSNGFKAVVDIDLLGTFHVMRAAFPHLKKPGAVAISISAPQAVLAMEAQIHVCAAKAGVDMVTRVLAMEWGRHGVRVLSVMPGPIEGTEGMKRLAPTPQMQKMAAETVPLKRMGTGADIADACLALASDYCRYISGAVIPVDGGWHLGGAAQSMAHAMREARRMGLVKTGD
jgi:NAD(P)-dependent dehydrogenase (short-subunit alcohol dehydrogenase family)